MTFQIRTADGRILTVHTEVGDGLTRVCFEAATQEDKAPSLEQVEDPSS